MDTGSNGEIDRQTDRQINRNKYIWNEQTDKDKCSSIFLLGVIDTKKKEFSKNKMISPELQTEIRLYG